MVYVEVFGGGGSVLLNKERSVREVLKIGRASCRERVYVLV